MTTEAQMEAMVNAITYKEGYEIRFAVTGGRPYIQVYCTRPDSITGEIGLGRGGEVYLSPLMTDSEIIRKCFGALLAYEEHECREWFRYCGKQIFGPHIHVAALMSICELKEDR